MTKSCGLHNQFANVILLIKLTLVEYLKFILKVLKELDFLKKKIIKIELIYIINYYILNV